MPKFPLHTLVLYNIFARTVNFGEEKRKYRQPVARLTFTVYCHREWT